jgi:hypothetical protein
MPGKKINPLDRAIMEGRKLPSKNKKGGGPRDYDVIMPGMGAKKPSRKPGNPKVSNKPAPLPKGPKPTGNRKATPRVSKKK